MASEQIKDAKSSQQKWHNDDGEPAGLSKYLVVAFVISKESCFFSHPIPFVNEYLDREPLLPEVYTLFYLKYR